MRNEAGSQKVFTLKMGRRSTGDVRTGRSVEQKEDDDRSVQWMEPSIIAIGSHDRADLRIIAVSLIGDSGIGRIG